MNHTQLRNCFFLIFILIASSIAFSGCKSTDNITPAPHITIGTYANPTSKNGDEELKLSDDGTYNMISPHGLVPVQGTYVVKENQVVFTETKDGHCTGISGTYIWSFDGKALAFTMVEDQCSFRRITLQSGSWVKQP